MEYSRATEKYTEQIYKLVQSSITETYPNYYPKEIVSFFCQLHSIDKIRKDIASGFVRILFQDNQIVGTGSFQQNAVTRVYVSPANQGHGYGSILMDRLEQEIAFNHAAACLDSSLPACQFYENRGYKTIQHEKRCVGNGVFLVYEIMEKKLLPFAPTIY